MDLMSELELSTTDKIEYDFTKNILSSEWIDAGEVKYGDMFKFFEAMINQNIVKQIDYFDSRSNLPDPMFSK